VKPEDIDVHTSISGCVGFCSSAKDGKVTFSSPAGGGELTISEDKRQAEVFILILEANNPTRETTKFPLINGKMGITALIDTTKSKISFLHGWCETVDQAQQHDNTIEFTIASNGVGNVENILGTSPSYCETSSSWMLF
jgi:hypothetical protein